MRPEGNPLDLNNFPDDYTRDGKQIVEDTSSGFRKKKSGCKDGKDDFEKVYECRFCSLKFCKSQALGGHMNRHRQERETETLNRARQLVFSNDNLAAQGQLSCCHPVAPPGGYHSSGSNMAGADPPLPLRIPNRLFSGSSSNFLAPPPQASPPYLYSSPSRPMYPQSHQHAMGDYYVGHVLSPTTTSSQYPHPNLNFAAPPPPETNFTCIGAPVGPGFGPGGGRGAELP